MRVTFLAKFLVAFAVGWISYSEAMHLCPGDRAAQLLRQGYSWPDVQRYCSQDIPLPMTMQRTPGYPATSPPNQRATGVPTQRTSPPPTVSRPSSRGGVFPIYDDALGMKAVDYIVPAGWWVDHKIALETQNPAQFFQYYLLDFYGPNGEFVTQIPPHSFSPALGQTFEKQWGQTLRQQLGHLGQYHMGNIVQSRLAHRMLPAPAQGGQVQSLEVPLRLNRQGQTFEGLSMAYLTYGQFTSMYSVVTVIAPTGTLPHTLALFEQIIRNQKKNPQYTARFNQIRQQLLQKFVVQSREVYQQRARSFQQFQGQMRAASAARSAQAAEFSRSLRSYSTSPRVSSNSNNTGYTTYDQFNDHLKDSTSFKDPYTGYRVTHPGLYEYWYTDSLGHYIGTNDPNFETGNLIGDWSKIDPLSP